ncbi:hypothetical protein RQP46_000223 [Phenoliferia psychrophenolica]
MSEASSRGEAPSVSGGGGGGGLAKITRTLVVESTAHDGGVRSTLYCRVSLAPNSTLFPQAHPLLTLTPLSHLLHHSTYSLPLRFSLGSSSTDAIEAARKLSVPLLENSSHSIDGDQLDPHAATVGRAEGRRGGGVFPTSTTGEPAPEITLKQDDKQIALWLDPSPPSPRTRSPTSDSRPITSATPTGNNNGAGAIRRRRRADSATTSVGEERLEWIVVLRIETTHGGLQAPRFANTIALPLPPCLRNILSFTLPSVPSSHPWDLSRDSLETPIRRPRPSSTATPTVQQRPPSFTSLFDTPEPIAPVLAPELLDRMHAQPSLLGTQAPFDAANESMDMTFELESNPDDNNASPSSPTFEDDDRVLPSTPTPAVRQKVAEIKVEVLDAAGYRLQTDGQTFDAVSPSSGSSTTFTKFLVAPSTTSRLGVFLSPSSPSLPPLPPISAIPPPLPTLPQLSTPKPRPTTTKPKPKEMTGFQQLGPPAPKRGPLAFLFIFFLWILAVFLMIRLPAFLATYFPDDDSPATTTPQAGAPLTSSTSQPFFLDHLLSPTLSPTPTPTAVPTASSSIAIPTVTHLPPTPTPAEPEEIRGKEIEPPFDPTVRVDGVSQLRAASYTMVPPQPLPNKKPAGRSEHIEDLSSYEFGAGGQEILKNERLMKDETQEKMAGFTYFLAMSAALSGFLFGYDTGVISGALVNIGTDIGGALLTDIEKEWVSAATSCGALVGGLLGGNIIDKFGRKWILALGDVFFVIGAVLVSSSFGLVQIIIGRIVLGFGVGIAAAVTPLYIAELAPTRFRGALVSIQSIMITLGQIVSYALAAGMTFHGGWRALFALSIIPSVVQGGLIPRYDLMNGREAEARKTLQMVYKGATDEMIDWKMKGMVETVALSKTFQERWPLRQRLSVIMRTGAYRRPTIVACGLMAFQQLCGFNSLLYYSATIFEAAGFSNGAAVGLIIAGTNFLFTGVAFVIMDRCGKRRLQLVTWPGVIGGLVMASISVHFMTLKTGGKLITGYTDYPQSWTIVMILSLVVFVAFYGHSSELFPLEIRGLGSSLLTASCWACNVLISDAGICFCGFVFTYFCYPEVANLSLEEVQTLFVDDFGIKAARSLRKEHKEAREKVLNQAEVRSLGGDSV